MSEITYSKNKVIDISEYSCKKCGNKILYDDTPYNRDEYKNLKSKFIELGCAICGERIIINEV